MREPEDVEDILTRQKALEAKRSRLNVQFREGYIEEDEYHEEMAAIKAALAQLEIPEPKAVIVAGEQLITFTAAWKKAKKETRSEMLHVMLTEVYVSVADKEIAGVVPHPDFLPLFRQTGMKEIKGRFII